MNIIWKGSPNYTKGRGGKAIEFIVCHWIVGDLAAADAVFANSARQSSAHYAVGNGIIHQYVIEPNTAWHAGDFDVNQRSIGIEHRGGPALPISDETYNTSADLIADICRRYGKRFPLRAHREFSATACPGTLDLNRLNQLVTQRLNNGGTILMDTADGQWLYQVALRRPAEDTSAGSAGQWNGLKPAEAMRRISTTPEYAALDAKLKGYDALAKQVAELSARPSKAELEAVVANLKLSEAKVSELEAQVQSNPDTILIDEGKNWLQKLIARLGGK